MGGEGIGVRTWDNGQGWLIWDSGGERERGKEREIERERDRERVRERER